MLQGTRELLNAVARATLSACAAVAIAAPLAVAETSPSLPTLKAQYRRPDSIPFPPANGYSDAKARLGETLFFDPRLSGPGTISCASCHNPGLGWKDGLPRGVGHNAQALPRATPTILNLAWTDLLMWDGRKDGLEDQATGPIASATEMNMPLPDLVARLSALPGYQRMFREAFVGAATAPVQITSTQIAQAIATFERTVVSNKAPFDRWIDGDETAISDQAQRGFVLFTGHANCASCHSGWRFTDDGFHDIGLPSEDPGRGAEIPDEPSLLHTFKTPTLRNIAVRAPYMHDGSLSSLQDVIRHYDAGFVQRPSLSPEIHRLALSAADAADIVAFMQTLTSQDDAIRVPLLPTKDSE